MKQISAGILLYRQKCGTTEFFLVHPGGPFWARKDAGAWTIPKGLASPEEDLLAAAKREFLEETGFPASGDFKFLGEFRQPSGKIIHVWAMESDCDPAALRSNLFSLEWPPKSGKFKEFPEIDRGGWFGLKEAEEKMLRGQRPIFAAFAHAISANSPEEKRTRSSVASAASRRAGKRGQSARARRH